MNNITLIGMPGVGKSTIGVVLAKVLGYQFLDSDLLIQNQEGDILEHLIDKHGIEGFLQIENQVNSQNLPQNRQYNRKRSAQFCKQ